MRENTAFSPFLILALALPLLTIRLSAHPAPWLDEGYKLNVARSLAERGEYGSYTIRGLETFDPGATTGPTTIVPLALSFRLFGAGMLQARLVIVAYALVALCASYALARRLYGESAAALITLGLVATPDVSGTSFVSMGRQVLGEMPALALTLVGFWLWDDGLRTGRRRSTIAAGACFGLGILAKVQIAIGMVPAMGIAALARVWLSPEDRLPALLPVGLALVVVAAWLTVERFGHPTAVNGDYLVLLTEGIRSNLLALRLGTQLSKTGWAVVLLLAAAVVSCVWRRREVFRSRRADDVEWLELTLALVVACSALWFVAFSIGWVRYVFVPLILALLLLGGAAQDGYRAAARRWPGAGRPLYAIVGAALVLIATSAHGLQAWRAPAEDPSQAMATHIYDQIPRDAVIETWEWELDALSGHWQYSHPHQRYMYEATRQHGAGLQPEIRGYDLLAADPDFLVRGPFSDWTHIYDSIEPHFVPVTEIGLYRLYRRSRAH